VLGIETSCDETSAAVLRGPRELLGHVILSQDVHALYGGVVPEIASRQHLRTIDDVVAGALARPASRCATSTSSPPPPGPASSARCSWA
jgi:N6-L-threonylcarbamoyladenine synthase